MSLNRDTARFTEFRQSLYGTFNNYADVLMNLIDAVSSNTTARTVVELSLNPLFERGYSALFKGIANLNSSHKSATCKPLKAQEPELKLSKQAAKMWHEGQADPIATDQDAPSPEACTVEKPLSSDHNCQAVIDTSGSTSSACQSKPTQVAQQHNCAARDRYLQAKDPSQLPEEPDWSIKSQPASQQPQPASQQPQPASQQPQPASVVESFHSAAQDGSNSKQALTKQAAQILWENQIQSLVVPYLPDLQKRPFHLFAIDVTSRPRQFSPTLQDRSFVYQANTIRGNKPVTIGHQYSVLAYLPEKTGSFCPPWVIPLSTRRVTTSCDKELVGLQQIQGLIENQSFDFKDQLSVQVIDSLYSKREFLSPKGRRSALRKCST